MSLTETLLAVGVFGVVAVAAANVLVNYGRTNAKVEDIGEIYDLRQYVRNSMSCEDTFANQSASDSCRSPGGGAIDIRDRSGNLLVSKVEGATTLFDYKLRGHCIENSGINEILIEYLPVNSRGTVKQDSLSRKTATWRSLTDKIPLVCSKTGQLIFTFVPRQTKNSERSRELFSQLCTDEAKKYGVAGKFKALISLTPRYPRHPDDTGKPFDAVDYIKIRGAVKNVAGETVAPSASEFWSINRDARVSDLTKFIPAWMGVATGSNHDGRYPSQCNPKDTNGDKQSCNCNNLQVSDSGCSNSTCKRFVWGNANYTNQSGDIIPSTINWAYSVLNTDKYSSLTICTFTADARPQIYCVEE